MTSMIAMPVKTSLIGIFVLNKVIRAWFSFFCGLICNIPNYRTHLIRIRVVIVIDI